MELRTNLEAYLRMPKVWRPAPDERMTLADGLRDGDSSAEKFIAGFLQLQIDKRLRRILKGEDARVVFALDRKRTGLQPNYARQQAAVCEVARLMADGLSRSDAIDAVVAFYGYTPRTIERWCSRWDEQSVDVSKYVDELRRARLI